MIFIPFFIECPFETVQGIINRPGELHRIKQAEGAAFAWKQELHSCCTNV